MNGFYSAATYIDTTFEIFLRGNEFSWPLNFSTWFVSILLPDTFRTGGGRWGYLKYARGSVEDASVLRRCVKFGHPLVIPENYDAGSADASRTLMDRMKTGSQEEINFTLAELQQLLGAELRNYVNHRFNSQGEVFVEELLHQTWVKVWLKMDQCRGFTCQSILAWIKKAALRIGINMVRDNRKFAELLRLESENSSDEDGSSPREETNVFPQENGGMAASMWRPTEDQVIFNDLIEKWRESLTDQERNVFRLILEGCSKSEIADMMDISRPRVSQYIEQISGKNAGIDW